MASPASATRSGSPPRTVRLALSRSETRARSWQRSTRQDKRGSGRFSYRDMIRVRIAWFSVATSRPTRRAGAVHDVANDVAFPASDASTQLTTRTSSSTASPQALRIPAPRSEAAALPRSSEPVAKKTLRSIGLWSREVLTATRPLNQNRVKRLHPNRAQRGTINPNVADIAPGDAPRFSPRSSFKPSWHKLNLLSGGLQRPCDGSKPEETRCRQVDDALIWFGWLRPPSRKGYCSEAEAEQQQISQGEGPDTQRPQSSGKGDDGTQH